MDRSFPPLRTDCWYVSGATATGKSAVGLALAERIGGEILSLDSMAVYRGMDIGTAKPSREARQRVPHHLLDLVDPNETFSVSEYLSAAHRVTEDVAARGRVPIFVGGTPLYLKALLRGLYVGPPADEAFRAAVAEDVRRHGIEALRRRLAEVDPLSAHRLDPNDQRRMTRALEVAYLTGRPISHQHVHFDAPPARARVFVLQWPRPVLHERIAQRVEQMFAAGLVDEVRRLCEQYAPLSATARKAVGYGEVIEHLEGRLTPEETIEQVKTHTRQLARRQESWFRHLPEAHPIAMEAERSPEEVAEELREARGERRVARGE